MAAAPPQLQSSTCHRCAAYSSRSHIQHLLPQVRGDWMVGRRLQRRVANTRFCCKVTRGVVSRTEWETPQSQVHTCLRKAPWLILSDLILWRSGLFLTLLQFTSSCSQLLIFSLLVFFGFDGSVLKPSRTFFVLFCFVFQVFGTFRNTAKPTWKCRKVCQTSCNASRCHLRRQHSTESGKQHPARKFCLVSNMA